MWFESISISRRHINGFWKTHQSSTQYNLLQLLMRITIPRKIQSPQRYAQNDNEVTASHDAQNASSSVDNVDYLQPVSSGSSQPVSIVSSRTLSMFSKAAKLAKKI